MTSPCPKNILDKTRIQINKMTDDPKITGSYSLNFDAENFTTIRIKLKKNVNSLVLFSPDSWETQYSFIKNEGNTGKEGDGSENEDADEDVDKDKDGDKDENLPDEVGCEDEAKFPHPSQKIGKQAYRDMPIILNVNFSGMYHIRCCSISHNELYTYHTFFYRHRGCRS